MSGEADHGRDMDQTDHRHRQVAGQGLAPLATLLCLLALPLPVAAIDTGVEIRNARTVLEDGTWYLATRIDYRPSAEAIDALQNGVPLTFSLQVEIQALRRWLWPATVATLRLDHELTWQPVARAYVIRDLGSDERRSHTTLYAALGDLGRVTRLPLIDSTALDDGARHEIVLRAVLDPQRLPGPLRLLSFWSDGFTLQSEWSRWPLQD